MNLDSILKWLATTITVAGAIAVANSWDPLSIYLFNIGSILWVWWAYRIKEVSIIVVNLAMLAVYLYGFVIRL